MKKLSAISFRISASMIVIGILVSIAVLVPYFLGQRITHDIKTMARDQVIATQVMKMHIAILGMDVAIRDNIVNMNLNVIGGVSPKRARKLMTVTLKGKYLNQAVMEFSVADAAYIKAKMLSRQSPDLTEAVQSLDKSWLLLRQNSANIIDLLRQLKFAGATNLFVNRSYLLTQHTETSFTRINHDINHGLYLKEKMMFKNMQTSRAVSLGLLIFALVLGGLLMGSIIRSLHKRLHLTLQSIQDIAEGEGDLTKRMPSRHRDELDFIADAFNRFVEKIQSLVNQVVNTTIQLADAADKFSVSSQKTMELTQQLQNETAQIATATEGMSASAKTAASKSINTLDAANEADHTTQKGQKVVEQTISMMHELATEVDQTARIIQTLENDGNQIGRVIEVINSISEQTNLLALNASIEAARAGEHGRGFAVVADEVRTLATKTKDSTGEISTMIERIQQGTRKAVMAMDQGREKAQAGVNQAQVANTALHSISQAVSNIKTLNSEIAELANNQSEIAQNLNQNILNISSNTDETASGAQMITVASNELAQLSAELKSIANQFKI